jgi:hypothetical protein
MMFAFYQTKRNERHSHAKLSRIPSFIFFLVVVFKPCSGVNCGDQFYIDEKFAGAKISTLHRSATKTINYFFKSAIATKFTQTTLKNKNLLSLISQHFVFFLYVKAIGWLAAYNIFSVTFFIFFI